MANHSRQFNLDEKIPEMDNYMFSKLFLGNQTKDSGKGITTNTLNEKKILAAFYVMMVDFDNSQFEEFAKHVNAQISGGKLKNEVKKNAKNVLETYKLKA